MAAIIHVFRRGAVYWWRRRLPQGRLGRNWGERPQKHIQASLGVRELWVARRLAAHLTAWSEYVFAHSSAGMLQQTEINTLFQAELRRLRRKFAAQAACDRAEGNRESEARQDRLTAEAMALAANRGITFKLTPADHQRLQSRGLSPSEIAEIQPTLAGLVETGLLPPSPSKIARLLREQGILDTSANLAEGETVHLRAIAIALSEQADTWDAGFIDDADHLREAATAAAREGQMPAKTFASTPDKGAASGKGDNPAEPAPAVSLSVLAKKLIAEKEKHKRWDVKTASQARQTFRLFGKSLMHDNLAKLTQSDLSDFKDLLSEIAKSYGKSGKDKDLTALQLRAKGAALDPEKRGLGVDATNRHLNFLSQLFEAAWAQGYSLDPKIDPAALRAQESVDPMAEVLPWTQDHRRKLYAQPPFVGSKSLKERMAPGDVIYHDGLYWCPLICDNLGLRREEAAGLTVMDVFQDEDTGLWAIEVRPNKFRRLKKTWTQRRLPVPDELLRLGFIEYVETIRKLGYDAVFPDLLPTTPGTPLGERLADQWVKIERAAFPDGKPEKTAFRSFRHSFNDDLKNANVSLEIRAELMGHKKFGETAGRYGDRFNLRLKTEAISKKPILTDKLTKHKIRLVPPVAARQPLRKARRRRIQDGYQP
jgi:hypothetical protein